MGNEKGMICPYCGGQMVWQSSEMASEVCDDYCGDEEALVEWYTCNKCGRDFEVFDPNEEGRNTAYNDYWNK